MTFWSMNQAAATRMMARLVRMMHTHLGHVQLKNVSIAIVVYVNGKPELVHAASTGKPEEAAAAMRLAANALSQDGPEPPEGRTCLPTPSPN